jgi:hypothetical protein
MIYDPKKRLFHPFNLRRILIYSPIVNDKEIEIALAGKE